MYLITGALGRIGTIIRNRNEELFNADVFDIRLDADQNILNDEMLHLTLNTQEYKAVIHLAELGQPHLGEDIRRQDIFRTNTQGTKNIIDLIRRLQTRLIYTVDLNKGYGDYARAKRINEMRVLNQAEKSILLPLPETLPAVETSTPAAFFDLLRKFAREENGVYTLLRDPGDIIYLGTETMISDVFNEILKGLDEHPGGRIDNSHVFAIKAQNFVEMLRLHFPETTINLVDRKTGETETNEEKGVEQLAAYFASLPFSALYLVSTASEIQ